MNDFGKLPIVVRRKRSRIVWRLLQLVVLAGTGVLIGLAEWLPSPTHFGGFYLHAALIANYVFTVSLPKSVRRDLQ